MSNRRGSDLTILVPVHNEALALPSVLDRLAKACPDGSELLVIDDGSTDGSGEIARARGLRVIENERSLGYGAALKAGLGQSSRPTVAIIDGDGSYAPEEIPELFALCPSGGMCVGARRAEPKSARKVVKAAARTVLRFLTGIEVPDLNSGLRVFDRSLADRLAPVLPARFSFTTTLTLGGIALGAPVRFQAASYRPRVGRSKFQLLDALRFARTVVRGSRWIQRGTVTPKSSSHPMRLLAFLAVLIALAYFFPAGRLDALLLPCLVGVAGYVPFVLAKVLRWRNLLRSMGVELDLLEASEAYVTGLAFGAVTPGRIGEAARILGPARDGRPIGALTIATVIDRLFDLGAVCLVAAAAGLWAADVPPWITLATCLGVGLVAAATAAGPVAIRVSERLLEVLSGARARRPALSRTCDRTWKTPPARALMEAGAWTAASMGLFFLIASGLLRAAGAEGPSIAILGAVAAGNLAALLPISIAGLGHRESTIMAALSLAGTPVDPGAVAAFALAFHAVFTVTPWIFFALFVARHAARRPAERAVSR